MGGQEMNEQSEKSKVETHDALIKHVFDNLRNVFICTTLLVACGAIFRYREQLQFGVVVNVVLSILLIFISFSLLSWNMVHGVQKIIQPYKKTRKRWLFLPLALLYMLVIVTIIQAWAMLQSESWRKHVTQHSSIKVSNTETVHTPNNAVIKNGEGSTTAPSPQMGTSNPNRK